MAWSGTAGPIYLASRCPPMVHAPRGRTRLVRYPGEERPGGEGRKEGGWLCWSLGHWSEVELTAVGAALSHAGRHAGLGCPLPDRPSSPGRLTAR